MKREEHRNNHGVTERESGVKNVKKRTGTIVQTVLRGCVAGILLGLIALSAKDTRAETVALDGLEHIHGLTVDAEQPDRLYLATHSGLFLASQDGTASRVGTAQDDFMSFAADPRISGTFYASGHPPGGDNLGVLISRDRGGNWEQISTGVGGPVDFHAMDVSRADPQVIYGIYKGLQMSRDGGSTWHTAGALPKDTFDLAASPRDSERVYAAARGGLFVSKDGGASWTPENLQRQPATLVHVAQDDQVYVFVYGIGLLVSSENEQGWELRSDDFNDRYLMHMTSDPGQPEVLHAISDTGAILTSVDGGRNWMDYSGHTRNTPERIAEAGQLYDRLCRSCHGAKGVGEQPGSRNATDEYGYVAPALDDSAHAWHHSDDDLMRMILDGSPRNPRMLPFGEFITESDAGDLLVYIKSLWSFRSLACQGARHMRCMQ